MLKKLWKALDVEPEETRPVGLLLMISFFMGLFMATFTVASQSLFLREFDEGVDLPIALAVSGGLGVVSTLIYNFLQGRMPFSILAIINLSIILAFAAFIEFGEAFVADHENLYYFGFALVLPFTFITQLIFWGAFNRMFNVRQAKRLGGSVDMGMTLASILSFFAIPVLLLIPGVTVTTLYTIGLVSLAVFLVLFVVLANRHLVQGGHFVNTDKGLSKFSIGQFLSNRYIMVMALFIVTSILALRFIDYSFFNATTSFYSDNPEGLPYFLALFEGTIVVFGFFFGLFGTDRLNQDYGLRISLIVNPLLLAIFTLGALGLGAFLGFEKSSAGQNFIYFFIMVAMSKLFINSLRDALDNPTFKFYYIPIDSGYKIDAQTKLEGLVTAVAVTLAGGLIVLINQFHIFNLLSITAFTLPILGLWYFVVNKMYNGYKDTLQGSLLKNKDAVASHVVREFTMDSILQKEIRSTAEDKVVYGLKLMEKLEPARFESSLLELAESDLKKVRQFAREKIQEYGFGQESVTRGLAQQAAAAGDDTDLLSISADKLMKLSKSVKQSDRILAAKLLRTMMSPKTIFILLELLRDADQKVRNESLITARKVKRQETWPVLVEMLASPVYGHAASAALKEAGEPALQVLEAAFHKSGQSDLVMMKIVQIMGHIGGKEGLSLLWKKADYPDKRIVKQILYSLRYMNYQAKGREVLVIKDLLDHEMSKTLWNLVALEELPEEERFIYLRDAIRDEIRDNYDQVSLLLSLLYDPQSVQLVRENIQLGTADSIQYALELLDLFLDNDLKPKLVPLLDDTSTNDKLEKLQVYFPRENYNPVQVINYVLNRDFNYSNRWTKACAIHATAYLDDFRVSRGLIGQMFNQDRLLQEVAAWVIYNKDKKTYQTISDRVPARDKRFMDNAIENNRLLEGLDDGFFLGIEMVMFIKELRAFRNIPGVLISDLADKIQPYTLNLRDKLVINPADGHAPILIVAHGEVKLSYKGQEMARLRKGSVFGDVFAEGQELTVDEVEATERAVVFRINMIDFYFVMARHHDLLQGIIRNVTEPTQTQTA
jgi:AAA family ATP:ADP antiporter